MNDFLLTILALFTVVGTSNVFQPRQQLAVITTGNRAKSPGSLPSLPRADYSRKINVRVGDVLTRQAEAAESDAFKFRPGIMRHPTSYDSNASERLNSMVSGATSSMAKIVVNSRNASPIRSQSAPTYAYSSTNSRSIINEDRSWPPENSQEFARVDVSILGKRIDSNALLYLRPNSNSSSISKLYKILGPDLDTEWMSADPPAKGREDNGRSTRSTLSNTLPQIDDRLQDAANSLNFTILRQAKESNIVVPVDLNTEQIDLMKDWLLQRAACNMNFIWEDLGPLFWPRWIRRGVCVNTHSCSWPPGMRCRPGGSRLLKLLRWVCTNDVQRTNEVKDGRRRKSHMPKFRRRRRDGRHILTRRYVSKEERRSRRVRRLINKLSLTARGYHCEWSRYEHMVSDHCTCSCG